MSGERTDAARRMIELLEQVVDQAEHQTALLASIDARLRTAAPKPRPGGRSSPKRPAPSPGPDLEAERRRMERLEKSPNEGARRLAEAWFKHHGRTSGGGDA